MTKKTLEVSKQSFLSKVRYLKIYSMKKTSRHRTLVVQSGTLKCNVLSKSVTSRDSSLTIRKATNAQTCEAVVTKAAAILTNLF